MGGVCLSLVDHIGESSHLCGIALMMQIAEVAGAEVVRTQWLDFSTVSSIQPFPA